MSSTRQMSPMDPTRRMLIARARDREQLRNQVISTEPGLSSEEVEQRVEQILFSRRSSGGRKAAANRATREAAAREIVAAVPELIARTEAQLNQLRMLATLAEDVA